MARVLTFLGILAGFVSAYFTFSAFALETTVVTTPAPEGYEGVANLQLMHIQMLQMLLGGVAAIVSAVMLVGGEICSRLDDAVERAQT